MKAANILGEGETLTAEQGQDGLAWLNDMLDTWNAQNLMVYSRTNQTVTATAGQDTYTVGTGGTWNIARPVRLVAAYQVYQDISYPLDLIELPSYDLIALKTQQNLIGRFLAWVNSYPLATAILWPVPQATQSIVLTTDNVLSSVPTLQTDLNFPPGYSETIRTNLAYRISTEYGVPVSDKLQSMAMQGLATIKKANWKSQPAQFEASITNPYVGLPGFYSGWA